MGEGNGGGMKGKRHSNRDASMGEVYQYEEHIRNTMNFYIYRLKVSSFLPAFNK